MIGFDTFRGFPATPTADTGRGSSEHLHAGAFSTHGGIRGEIESLASVHDHNRPLGHIPKIELVTGDATETIPAYVHDHPHLLVSLLYLDFDLYEPTRAALAALLPRVVRGGVIAFDELNCADFPGETTALLECLDISGVELKRFAFEPYISYFARQ